MGGGGYSCGCNSLRPNSDGSMKTVNFTRIPTKLVSSYLRFAIKSVGAQDLVRAIVLLPDLDVHGTISETEDGKFILLIRVSKEDVYPYSYRYPGIPDAPSYQVRDVAEHIVSTVAHEAFHAVQSHFDTEPNEIHAEVVSFRTIEAWREKQSSGHG